MRGTKSTLNWNSKKIRRLLSAVSELDIPVLFHMQESNEMIAPFEQDGLLKTTLVKLMRSDFFYQIPKSVMHYLTLHCPPLMEWKQRRKMMFPGYMLDFASLETALVEFPKVDFIGHGPLFWKHISSDPPIGYPYAPTGHIKKGGILCNLLKTYPNLYADISGESGFYALIRDRRFIQNFLEEFSHKILFGTDTCLLGQQELLSSFALSKGCMDKIYYGNALKLQNSC
jgi:predicted TIM-barrel fold metal-dependent hydrolase